MLLSVGTRLGSYEIVAPLGEGGMGEVYKARDLRLNRLIALKILPGTSALDADRRMRFEREAQAIAALNHPNIVTIFSVEEQARSVGGDEVKDEPLLFLTMELVEGHALADAIPKHGVRLERLLQIGIAVAHAVAAAHQKGITHRDLKPGNIMLGEGEQAGRVKVLDFGLAKLTAALPESETATTLPVQPDTGAGASSAPSPTCRPSRRKASQSTLAPTCSRLASSSTKWPLDAGPSPVTRASR
jgi:serine/threonine protein kinase